MIIRSIQFPTYDRKKYEGKPGKSPADIIKEKDPKQQSFSKLLEQAMEDSKDV